MLPASAHEVRIRLLQSLVKNDKPGRYSASVDQKRRFEAVFDGVAWEQNLKKVYEDVADSHRLKHFKIYPMLLNDSSFQLLASKVDDIIATSVMERTNDASDTDKMTLIDAVVRAVFRECSSRVKLERNASFKCTALEAFGELDLLRAGGIEKSVVFECGGYSFDKGIAR
ncbi:unnamed protein product [Phytophthora lilii]|uniref:Unnamed protein product n=1 Tax=Phytophthora lilii TaxID=2077276 RepID=A0A9W6WXP0_9STRA|nr:unnamed protein product [Phytophthora lilii]